MPRRSSSTVITRARGDQQAEDRVDPLLPGRVVVLGRHHRPGGLAAHVVMATHAPLPLLSEVTLSPSRAGAASRAPGA